MNTVDMLKKTLAFTIGAAEFSREKIKQFTDEMVSQGEISKDEAKKFVDDVTKRAEDEKQSIQDWMREQANKILQQAGAVEVAKFDELEARVAFLEKHFSAHATEHTHTPGCIIDPVTNQCTSQQVPE